MKKKKRKNSRQKNLVPLVVGLSVLVIILIGIYAIIHSMTRPDFSLSSDLVTVEAGSDFEPYRMIVSVNNAEVSDIIIAGSVSCNVPGLYEVHYELDGNVQTVSVNVVDTTAPTLEVKEAASYIEYDEIKVEDLVVSVDDISEVTVSIVEPAEEYETLGSHEIHISAKDIFGNETLKTCLLEIEAFDSTAPTILGIEDIEITEGNQIDLMEGVEVTDDIDSSPAIEVDDSGLDITMPGVYTVYYFATDSYGNVSTAERTVTVVAKPAPVVPEAALPPSAGGTTSENAAPVTTPGQGGTGVVITASDGSSYTIPFDVTGIPGQPYFVAVNRSLGTVTVYGKDDNGNYTVPVRACRCSVGKYGHETPTGRYTTSSRYEWCYMVDGTWGRYAIRINGGIMFHSVCYFTKDMSNLEYEEFNKLGSPASLGCVRLCVGDILWLYLNCPTGFETLIYDDPVSPGPMGKPAQILIDVNDAAGRGWDPTDPFRPT